MNWIKELELARADKSERGNDLFFKSPSLPWLVTEEILQKLAAAQMLERFREQLDKELECIQSTKK